MRLSRPPSPRAPCKTRRTVRGGIPMDLSRAATHGHTGAKPGGRGHVQRHAPHARTRTYGKGSVRRGSAASTRCPPGGRGQDAVRIRVTDCTERRQSVSTGHNGPSYPGASSVWALLLANPLIPPLTHGQVPNEWYPPPPALYRGHLAACGTSNCIVEPPRLNPLPCRLCSPYHSERPPKGLQPNHYGAHVTQHKKS